MGKQSVPESVENFLLIFFFHPVNNASFIFCLTARVLTENIFLTSAQSNLLFAFLNGLFHKKAYSFLLYGVSVYPCRTQNIPIMQFAMGKPWHWVQEQGGHHLELVL